MLKRVKTFVSSLVNLNQTDSNLENMKSNNIEAGANRFNAR